MILKISNASKKRCREKFPIKGIGKIINNAVLTLEKVDVEVVIAESIYDFDNKPLYNVILYLIRENCNDFKIINELNGFNYEC